MSKKKPRSRPAAPNAEARPAESIAAARPRNYQVRFGLPLGILAIIVSMVLFGSNRKRSETLRVPKARSAPPINEYVDAKTCAACHKGVAESFSHTGMAHSLTKPARAGMVEDFDVRNTVYNKASGNYYTMVRRAGEYFERRHQIGFDGKKTNLAEERIDYIIGSGDQARSYLHRSPEGMLIELPVTWYSEKGGYWAMTPGYDFAGQKDFHGVISKDCIFCHDAYPPEMPKEFEDTGEPIFSSALPLGIDCQRCHGPGGEHEKAARSSGSDLKHIEATIINPAHLTRERQLDVCMECHLSTSGSQDSNISLRFSRNIFSYRPGEPLTDYKLFFDFAQNQNPGGFRIADAAYRLRMSSCFKQSKMTCLTCHDPHQESHGKAVETHYIQICVNCHREVKHKIALPKNETCLSCHMPKRRGEYAVHIVLTDHYIQRQRPNRDLLAPSIEPPPGATTGKLAPYYPEKLRDDSDDQLYLSIAEAEDDTNPLHGANVLEAVIRHDVPPEAGFYAALGGIYAEGGAHLKAIDWFEEALQKQPSDRLVTAKLVESLIAVGQLDRAQQILESVVGHPPPDGKLLANLGNIYARKGQLEKAESALQRALSVDSESAESYNLLGMVKEREGNRAEAAKFYRESIRRRPDLAEARNNLALLLVAIGHFDEAGFQFQQAVEADPGFAEAHHSYGLFLVATKSMAQAEAQLRAAIRLDSNPASFHSDLADLLAEHGRLAEASDEYKIALQRDSKLDTANIGLGMILVRQGDVSGGKSYCGVALNSADPSIVDQARTCLGH